MKIIPVSARFSRRYYSAFLALFLAFAAPLFASPAAPDPVEGLWLGQAGPADNRANIGLEIVREANGELAAFYTVDLVKFYHVPTGEPVKSTGPGRYTYAGGLQLNLEGERLLTTGFLDNHATVELHRVAALPQPEPLPVAPAGPGPRWRTRTGGAIFAAPAVHDGFAYVGNIDGVFLALKISDGTKVWAFAAGRPVMGEALATEDAVFFACDNGSLFKLNRVDGKELWRYDLGDGRVNRILPNPYVYDYDYQSPRPVLADGVLYLGSGDGAFHAVRADTGARVWRIETKAKIRTTALVHGDRVFFSTLGNTVYAIECATGHIVWQFATGDAVTSSPALIGGRLIIGDRDSKLHALDPADGREVWSQNWWGSWVESTAVELDGLAYIGSGDLEMVSCIDPATGRNLWRTDVGGWVMRAPAVTAKSVYASVAGAHRLGSFWLPQTSAVVALNRATGKVRWSWLLPGQPGGFLHGFLATPVIAGDTLLVGGIDGTLYAFPVE